MGCCYGKSRSQESGSTHRRCTQAAAAQHGRSAEAEHRALLEALLVRPKGKSFAEALTGMPNVGQDKDFERAEDEVENDRVFG